MSLDPQTSLSKFRSLLHISSILNANLDLHQLLPLIMLYSKDLLEAEASSLFLLEDEEFLYCEVALGEKGEIIQQYARLELGEGIVGMVAREKKPIALEDAYKDPRFNASMDKRTGFKTKSLICVPLFVEERLIGTLEVINKTNNRIFDSSDLEYLISLSEVAATAIQNANTKDSLDKRILELSLLYEFERLSVSEKSLNELGKWILNRVLEYLGASSGTIYLANADKQELSILSAKGIPEDAYDQIKVPYGTGVSGWVAEKRESLLIHNLDLDPRYNKLAPYKFESKSLISAPLIFQEELLGVISINNKVSGYAFQHSDLDLLTNIAARLSSTIKNAQLFHQIVDTGKELNRAKNIMKKIMPSILPKSNGLSYGVAHIPLEQVGGDFYDVTELEDSKFSILIADISGHGLSAAVLAAMAHMVLKNFEQDIKQSPSLFLTTLNHMLYGKLAGNFLTAFYGIIDLKNNTLLCANAGHHAPFLLDKKDSPLIQLDVKGKILGLIPDLFYEEKTFPFIPGNRLVMYTDGITEHMSKDHNKRYDEDLFQKAILKSKTLDSQNSADDLIRAAREYVGTNDFADDVTVLLVDRI
ncbi:GAF domain-containing SpoIIE family protein phosphatase [Leptospira meyeri]|uniref:GAF domain-containing SpoIIE family protein phosphatase n=1 Tax=Leptospira meyeri TaxID=29508 RepID=UPI000C2A0E92|nr:GAF domain-containing SpoIIE family protein phosphatase [Leptospira meyeri]PKA25328.1 serine/threonine protein phosphatase [Leptospira sp. mixed culture ATI2-C-A1]MCW7489444.1 SpoIIE family protein phosphatase [Leptospira meyeri]PJZ82383.1 serine/threonine protein phosphatase [Leptospira meyeri]PJZ98690.1 serine/threonine protein phosphatase [Leptospira meyeri]PKA11203.1 serine/threonine protein phosphatase [Leptospira meyeri]